MNEYEEIGEGFLKLHSPQYFHFMLYTFFYHTISDEDLGFAKHLYPIKSVKEFEEDLDFLLANFEILKWEQLKNWQTIQKPTFLLTFDDGLRQVGEIIAPILLKRGIPAIFFVNKSFALHEAVFYKNKVSWLKSQIEDRTVWQKLTECNFHESGKINHLADQHGIDLNMLRPKDLYLSKNEIKSLSDKGFMIGAHSVNHPHFKDIDEVAQLRQINESVQWVVENFNSSMPTFAFPFEDYFLKKSFFEKVYKLPFSPQITFGTSDGKEDVILNSIQRIDAERSGLPLEILFKKHKRKRFLRKLFFKNKLNRT